MKTLLKDIEGGFELTERNKGSNVTIISTFYLKEGTDEEGKPHFNVLLSESRQYNLLREEKTRPLEYLDLVAHSREGGLKLAYDYVLTKIKEKQGKNSEYEFEDQTSRAH